MIGAGPDGRGDRRGLMKRHGVDVPGEAIAAFCRRNHIRKPALFGSVLREDSRPDSDVDVLVNK